LRLGQRGAPETHSYINNDEAFAGGNYDYDAHLITTSVEFEY
jgi:hypothetical protein